MSAYVLSFDGISETSETANKSKSRQYKGKSIISFPENFCVVDIETTGLSSEWDEIIELSALRVRNNEIVQTFNSLVKPTIEIDDYITELTGITNEMLENAPSPESILADFISFVGYDIIVGHNVNFDINFLYDYCLKLLDKPLENDFVDTLRISRKALPDLKHHRLKDIMAYFDIKSERLHRATEDCNVTFECYISLRKAVLSSCSTEDFVSKFNKPKRYWPFPEQVDLRKLTTDKTFFDESSALFGKICVFTGKLDRMTRVEAAQLVVDLGGSCENSVTKKTNFLVLGNNDYCQSIKGGKSNKQKKAEEYKIKGCDIEIIPENVFYEMLAME